MFHAADYRGLDPRSVRLEINCPKRMPTPEYYKCRRAMFFRNGIQTLPGKAPAKLPVAVGLELVERLKCVVTPNLVPFELINPRLRT